MASAFASVSCEGEDNREAQPRPRPEERLSLIRSGEIKKLARASVERAFFEYWSSLQFQAWPEAASYLAPGLTTVAGGEREVIAALNSQVSFFRTAKPRLVSSTERRGLTTLRYTITDDAMGRAPRSNAWQKRDGRWEIVHDAFLDDVLAAYAVTSAQERINPSAKEPSERAQRAGRRVAERQAEYLERLLAATSGG